MLQRLVSIHCNFQAPVSPPPATDVQDALDYGNVCMQRKELSVIGDEDCLFLNVFTPALDREASLPVIFAIEGKGYSIGSGNSLGPELLLDRDVVLVTFNYRLGPLGFLSLGTVAHPGNYGLEDQILALEWVNRNIHNFGGNSSSITLYGHGAGAASAHLLLLSNGSELLFQRAVINGGSAFVPWAYNVMGHNRKAVYEFAEKYIENANSSQEEQKLLEFLQNVDAELLVNETTVEFYSYGGSVKGAIVEWAPVVDGMLRSASHVYLICSFCFCCSFFRPNYRVPNYDRYARQNVGSIIQKYRCHIWIFRCRESIHSQLGQGNHYYV